MVLINNVVNDYTTRMDFLYQGRVFIYEDGKKTIMSKEKYLNLLSKGEN